MPDDPHYLVFRNLGTGGEYLRLRGRKREWIKSNILATPFYPLTSALKACTARGCQVIAVGHSTEMHNQIKDYHSRIIPVRRKP